MELSLDDIIRKQRKFKLNRPTPVLEKTAPKRPNDARNRIILKKRTKITDARDKLAEIAKKKDARVKLEQLRMKRGAKMTGINRPTFGNALQRNRNGVFTMRSKGIFTDMTRQVRPSPLILAPGFGRNEPESPVTPISGYPMDISMDEEYVPTPLKPIVRRIDNDTAHYLPPPPTFPALTRIGNRRPLRDKAPLGDLRTPLNFKIIAKNDMVSPSSGGMLKRIRASDDVIYVRDNSPPGPVSILKKRPFGGKVPSRSRYDPTSSNRIGATNPQRSQRPPTPPQESGFRIVVSNLQSSVTASDIRELFDDIGQLMESRLVRPGTAEVIYSSLKDAQKAVDVYHNRQLDGQPMKCFLVNPRNPPSTSIDNSSKFGNIRGNKPTLPASSNSSVVPDISTFHKVLFRKH